MSDTATQSKIAEIIKAVRAYRIPLSTEAAAQEAIEEALSAAGISFVAQKVLTPKDRLDLLIDGIAVEIKVKGGRTAIFRQLERYAAHPDVRGIVLATGVAWPFQGGEIGGKPFGLISLGQGWL